MAMTTGQIIQAIRKEKGYTQKQLAEKCGMATGTIQQYELNKREPRQEQLRKIANALEIPVSDLLGAIYNEKNSSMFNQFYFGNINPENMTNEQLMELYHTVTKNEVIRKSWETEKEKWAVQEITKYLKKLTPAGQDEAVIRVEELTHSPRFKKPFIDEEPPKE